jgi:heme/copper-type cytochrome/quinol oxidase subunit 4
MSANGPRPSSERGRGLSPAATGWLVFVALVVLAVVEYVVFLAVHRNLIWMVVMNVADAALILVYFMHLPRLWRGH